MSPRALLPAFFLISLAVAGQTASPAPGLIVNGGYVVGPIGNGQVAASTVTFGSPAPTAAASVSGIAGISDHAPLQQAAPTNMPAPTVVYTTAAPTNVVYTNQSGANAAGTQEATPAPVNDLAPSFYAGSNAAGTAGSNGSLSLGEVSALNKARNGAQHARTYTNADVQRLISHQGAGNIMEAANRPPVGIAAPGQNPQASTSTAPQNMAGSANATSAQNQAPTTQPNPPQSTTASPQGTASAEANAANQSAASNETRQNSGTTPQFAQPQQTETQPNNQQLPATSTILPLLGLLGITASGVGLWFRRFRK